MIEIYRGSPIQAMNIYNLLQNSGIEVFVLNELMASIEPWVVSPGGSAPMILSVNKKDVERALGLIADYDKGDLSL